MKLDLGCGKNKQEGFIGVDIIKEGTHADLEVDLEIYPWPWEDQSVEEIHCSHYIEHTKDLMKFMNEIYRILIPGGIATFIAPYYTSVRCWQDPTHTRAISEATFSYFMADWRKENGLEHYPINCDFEVIKCEYAFNKDYINAPKGVLEHATRHYWNVVDDIYVVLRRNNGR